MAMERYACEMQKISVVRSTNPTTDDNTIHFDTEYTVEGALM